MCRRLLILDNSIRSFENFRRNTFDQVAQNLGLDFTLHAPKSPYCFLFSALRFLQDLFFVRDKVVILITIPAIILAPLSILFTRKLILFFPGLGRTYRGSDKKIRYILLRLYLALCIKLSSRVVVLNKADKALLGGHTKISILNSEGLELSENLKINKRNSYKNLSFVGRPIKDKGFEAFLDEIEFRNNEDLIYNFFGDGFEDKELECRSDRLRKLFQNYIVHGYCEKTKIWKNTDILFFPTVYGEGFPFVVLEALKHGCHIFLRHSHWTEHLPPVETITFEKDKTLAKLIEDVEPVNITDQNATIVRQYLIDNHDITTVVVPFWIELIKD